MQLPVISCTFFTLSQMQCPAVPPVPTSATHQCPPPVPPISVSYQCSIISAASSVPADQCHLSVPISAAYPCHLISAHQCSLSVPISAESSTHIS
ncbi:unnamed protein product, partial [Staurois parvus]